MPYVLDTDIITALQRFNRSVLARARSLPRADVFVTIVSYQEQTAGQLATLNTQLKPDALIIAYGELAQLLLFYRSANVLAYDNEVSRIDSDLRRQLPRMGTKDRRIAAIALAHGYTLVTRNTVDFQNVPGLSLEDWMAS